MARRLFIINPNAGGGLARQRVEELIRALGAEAGYDLRFTSAPGDATRLAAELALEFDQLIAVGGDGTVAEVANGLLASGATASLALLPLGTGNDFGRGLGIPDWETAAAALRNGLERPVDVVEVCYTTGGEVVQTLALIAVGAGFPADLLTRCTLRAKKLLGRSVYHYAAFATIAACASPSYRLELDGQEFTGRLVMVAVANLERTAGGTVAMAPGAVCDDGLLDVVLVRAAGRLRLFQALRRTSDGCYLQLPEVERYRTRSIRIESTPPARLNIDGELLGSTPVTLTVRPGALRVRVPGA